MIFKQIPSGGDRNFGYLAACEVTGLAAVIDPSPNPEACFQTAEKLKVKVTYVINTHSHYDHSGGNNFFKEKSQAAVISHELASSGDIKITDGQTLPLGELNLDFIHTPGHTIDSICIKITDELITGDTLFVGKIGGTYTEEAAKQEFDSLKILMALPDNIKVWPGHNYGVRPSSTIGEERKSNPFCLRLKDFNEFIWLKNNWEMYKKEHNIL